MAGRCPGRSQEGGAGQASSSPARCTPAESTGRCRCRRGGPGRRVPQESRSQPLTAGGAYRVLGAPGMTSPTVTTQRAREGEGEGEGERPLVPPYPSTAPANRCCWSPDRGIPIGWDGAFAR